MKTQEEKKIVIAIDGYSSSGKSTMARNLARRLGYRYIDSGAMYRAVTLFAIRNNLTKDAGALVEALKNVKIDFTIAPDGKQVTMLNGENVEQLIRGMEVSALVSEISKIPEVRHQMVKQQQNFGLTKGVVMDGRDICTTVFPNAELKIFVNASAEMRAKRRFEELRAKGDDTSTFEEVLENIRKRDYDDTHREESPMYIAPDAVVLDNSEMTLDCQDRWLDALVKKRIEDEE